MKGVAKDGTRKAMIVICDAGIYGSGIQTVKRTMVCPLCKAVVGGRENCEVHPDLVSSIVQSTLWVAGVTARPWTYADVQPN